jgi:hypothetical protein
MSRALDEEEICLWIKFFKRAEMVGLRKLPSCKRILRCAAGFLQNSAPLRPAALQHWHPSSRRSTIGERSFCSVLRYGAGAMSAALQSSTFRRQIDGCIDETGAIFVFLPADLHLLVGRLPATR